MASAYQGLFFFWFLVCCCGVVCEVGFTSEIVQEALCAMRWQHINSCRGCRVKRSALGGSLIFCDGAVRHQLLRHAFIAAWLQYAAMRGRRLSRHCKLVHGIEVLGLSIIDLRPGG